MTCHVYDSRYCKVLTIACCDMQSEDGATQILFWKILNSIMAENSVPNIHFKEFMADKAQANWNVVRTIYEDGDPSLPMVARERACLFQAYKVTRLIRCSLRQGDPEVYQTILAISTQTNMQGLQKRENNGRRRD